MSEYFIFEKLGIALLLGFLVGLQREKSQSAIAGFRTFPLITILGSLCGLLAQTYGTGILVGGIFSLIALIVVGNFAALRHGNDRTGITTEVAMLMMFAVGAYLIVGPALVCIALGGGVAVLLQFKPELHGFASRLGDTDIKAIMRFVLLSFIILPILPNDTYGPFEVLNPHEIWLMVVFIVGMNLSGYIVSKFVGNSTGTLTSGILGGLISSTATTVSSTQNSSLDTRMIPRASTVILIASTFAYIRVAIEIAGVSNTLFQITVIPIGILFVASLILSALSYFSTPSTHQHAAESKRPSEVRTALLFGITYAAVVFCTAAAKKYLGPNSLYWVAGISGLTDVDAITLSTSRLVAGGKLEPLQAKQMILIAVLSNLLFKLGIVAALGDRRLLARLSFCFGLLIGVGCLLLFLG